MTEVSRLGVHIESTGADKATRDLHGVERAGRDAAGGLDVLSTRAVAAGALIAGAFVQIAGSAAAMAQQGVKAAADLQHAVAGIATIKPEIDTSAVSRSLKDLSTQTGQSAKDLAAGLYDTFSSIEVSQGEALALTEQFAKGATAAQTEAKTFGTAVIGVMNAYKLSVADADHISDVFFETVKSGVVTGQELAVSLGPVTQAAKSAGVSLDELGAMIAGVTKEGGPAAQNINNLNNLLQKFQTTEAQKDLQALGVATTTATGAFRPVLAVLTDLKAKLAEMPPAIAAAKLNDIFPDAQARQGAQTIMSQLEFVGEALERNRTQVGATAAAYKTMSETSVSAGQRFEQTWTALLSDTAEIALPGLTVALGVVGSAVHGMRAAVEEAHGPWDEMASRAAVGVGGVGVQLEGLKRGVLETVDYLQKNPVIVQIRTSAAGGGEAGQLSNTREQQALEQENRIKEGLGKIRAEQRTADEEWQQFYLGGWGKFFSGLGTVVNEGAKAVGFQWRKGLNEGLSDEQVAADLGRIASHFRDATPGAAAAAETFANAIVDGWERASGGGMTDAIASDLAETEAEIRRYFGERFPTITGDALSALVALILARAQDIATAGRETGAAVGEGIAAGITATQDLAFHAAALTMDELHRTVASGAVKIGDALKLAVTAEDAGALLEYERAVHTVANAISTLTDRELAAQIAAMRNAAAETGSLTGLTDALALAEGHLAAQSATQTAAREAATAATREAAEAERELERAAKAAAAEQERITKAGASIGESRYGAILSAVQGKATLETASLLEMTKATHGVQAALEQAANLGLRGFAQAMVAAGGDAAGFQKALAGVRGEIVAVGAAAELHAREQARRAQIENELASQVLAGKISRAQMEKQLAAELARPGGQSIVVVGGVPAPGWSAGQPVPAGHTGVGLPPRPGFGLGLGELVTRTDASGERMTPAMARAEAEALLKARQRQRDVEYGPTGFPHMTLAELEAQAVRWGLTEAGREADDRTRARLRREQRQASSGALKGTIAHSGGGEDLWGGVVAGGEEATQTVEAFGEAGRRAFSDMRDHARLAIPALGGIKMAYDGVGAAVQTLAQLEAARAQASLAWGKMLTAGTWNVAGFAVPATNLGSPASGSGSRTGTIPATGGNIYGGQNNIYGIPMFDRGGVMPYDGLAHLRRGETVTPAGSGGGPVTINIHVGEFPLGVTSPSEMRTRTEDLVHRWVVPAMRRAGVMG